MNMMTLLGRVAEPHASKRVTVGISGLASHSVSQFETATDFLWVFSRNFWRQIERECADAIDLSVMPPMLHGVPVIDMDTDSRRLAAVAPSSWRRTKPDHDGESPAFTPAFLLR